MNIHGNNFIGATLSAAGKESCQAYHLKAGQVLNGHFISASNNELNQAVELAQEAFQPYRQLSQMRRADFLDTIAQEISDLNDDFIERASQETALPKARITGERVRTVNQLNSFADLLREGSWLEATIDLAQSDRQPIPKVDLRRLLVPIGPVTVFAASNFPLAFSVAGGDTASALAAGNPVIVKAHSGHMGTSEMIAGAIIKAAKKTGMPDGVFSMLHGPGRTIGQALVKHPGIKAVGFTGSLSAGRLLFDLANARPEPIPVFAEMGSINPVFVAPKALKLRADEIAKQYAASITLGVGQFCTNPGLIVGLAGEDLDQFMTTLGQEIRSIAPATMLNQTVFNGYQKSYDTMLSQSGIQSEGCSEQEAQSAKSEATSTVASVSGKIFLSNPAFREEVFGPFSLIVKCADVKELESVLSNLAGQLTTTIMAEKFELQEFSSVVDILNQRSGRIIFNGVPTGVEVCAAMQHGGPYPACTDSRFTSVGTAAIKRFVRPVSFQNWPDEFLPDELKNENPLGIWHLVDNNWNNDATS